MAGETAYQPRWLNSSRNARWRNRSKADSERGPPDFLRAAVQMTALEVPLNFRAAPQHDDSKHEPALTTPTLTAQTVRQIAAEA